MRRTRAPHGGVSVAVAHCLSSLEAWEAAVAVAVHEVCDVPVETGLVVSILLSSSLSAKEAQHTACDNLRHVTQTVPALVASVTPSISQHCEDALLGNDQTFQVRKSIR